MTTESDPVRHSPWSQPETIAGFTSSSPNPELIAFARRRLARGGDRLLDVGCGAARNGLALAEMGWHVLGVDLSAAMLAAARNRAREAGLESRLQLALAPMDRLPVLSRSVHCIVAHGIWNLARSQDEFRRALAEAARVAVAGATLFVFTFSRNTLSADARPVAGQQFVFTDFSGEPQCFLTEEQLVGELALLGFAPSSALPLTELNRSHPGALCLASRAPVIWQGAFTFVP